MNHADNKDREREITERRERPNQESIEHLERKKIFKYLEILEADDIKQTEMKEQIRKEYLRTRKLTVDHSLDEVGT